jgi:hypothetical protein
MTICKTNTDIYATGEGRSALTHVRLLARGSFRGRCASKVLVPLYMCLYMCPHATINVSHTTINVCAYYCMCVHIVLYYMCPHATLRVLYCVCVIILLCVSSDYNVSAYHYVCPHTTTCVLILLCVSSCCYVSSYYYICFLRLLYMCPWRQCTSTDCICVLILLYIINTHTQTHTHTHTQTHTHIM